LGHDYFQELKRQDCRNCILLREDAVIDYCLVDEFSTLIDAEHTIGGTSVGVTQFFGFLQTSKQGWVVFGVQFGRNGHDLIFGITQHDIL